MRSPNVIPPIEPVLPVLTGTITETKASVTVPAPSRNERPSKYLYPFQLPINNPLARRNNLIHDSAAPRTADATSRPKRNNSIPRPQIVPHLSTHTRPTLSWEARKPSRLIKLNEFGSLSCLDLGGSDYRNTSVRWERDLRGARETKSYVTPTSTTPRKCFSARSQATPLSGSMVSGSKSTPYVPNARPNDFAMECEKLNAEEMAARGLVMNIERSSRKLLCKCLQVKMYLVVRKSTEGLDRRRREAVVGYIDEMDALRRRLTSSIGVDHCINWLTLSPANSSRTLLPRVSHTRSAEPRVTRAPVLRRSSLATPTRAHDLSVIEPHLTCGSVSNVSELSFGVGAPARRLSSDFATSRSTTPGSPRPATPRDEHETPTLWTNDAWMFWPSSPLFPTARALPVNERGSYDQTSAALTLPDGEPRSPGGDLEAWMIDTGGSSSRRLSGAQASVQAHESDEKKPHSPGGALEAWACSYAQNRSGLPPRTSPRIVEIMATLLTVPGPAVGTCAYTSDPESAVKDRPEGKGCSPSQPPLPCEFDLCDVSWGHCPNSVEVPGDGSVKVPTPEGGGMVTRDSQRRYSVIEEGNVACEPDLFEATLEPTHYICGADSNEDRIVSPFEEGTRSCPIVIKSASSSPKEPTDLPILYVAGPLLEAGHSETGSSGAETRVALDQSVWIESDDHIISKIPSDCSGVQNARQATEEDCLITPKLSELPSGLLISCCLLGQVAPTGGESKADLDLALACNERGELEIDPLSPVSPRCDNKSQSIHYATSVASCDLTPTNSLAHLRQSSLVGVSAEFAEHGQASARQIEVNSRETVVGDTNELLGIPGTSGMTALGPTHDGLSTTSANPFELESLSNNEGTFENQEIGLQHLHHGQCQSNRRFLQDALRDIECSNTGSVAICEQLPEPTWGIPFQFICNSSTSNFREVDPSLCPCAGITEASGEPADANGSGGSLGFSQLNDSISAARSSESYVDVRVPCRSLTFSACDEGALLTEEYSSSTVDYSLAEFASSAVDLRERTSGVPETKSDISGFPGNVCCVTDTLTTSAVHDNHGSLGGLYAESQVMNPKINNHLEIDTAFGNPRATDIGTLVFTSSSCPNTPDTLPGDGMPERLPTAFRKSARAERTSIWHTSKSLCHAPASHHDMTDHYAGEGDGPVRQRPEDQFTLHAMTNKPTLDFSSSNGFEADQIESPNQFTIQSRSSSRGGAPQPSADDLFDLQGRPNEESSPVVDLGSWSESSPQGASLQFAFEGVADIDTAMACGPTGCSSPKHATADSNKISPTGSSGSELDHATSECMSVCSFPELSARLALSVVESERICRSNLQQSEQDEYQFILGFHYSKMFDFIVDAERRLRVSQYEEQSEQFHILELTSAAVRQTDFVRSLPKPHEHSMLRAFFTKGAREKR